MFAYSFGEAFVRASRSFGQSKPIAVRADIISSVFSWRNSARPAVLSDFCNVSVMSDFTVNELPGSKYASEPNAASKSSSRRVIRSSSDSSPF